SVERGIVAANVRCAAMGNDLDKRIDGVEERFERLIGSLGGQASMSASELEATLEALEKRVARLEWERQVGTDRLLRLQAIVERLEVDLEEAKGVRT
ncbi:MAG TPA: hypothetical protein VJM51_01555, partial [Dehalococcoidia bacterium]|nr:hypothetical protein [Dehalococcoidia bacterium]